MELKPHRDESFALFDDTLGAGPDRLLWGAVETLHCFTPDDLARGFAAIEAARRSGYWVALAASYELGYALEPRLHRCLPTGLPTNAPTPTAQAPLLSAWVFRHAESLAPAQTAAWLATQLDGLSQHQRAAGVGGWRASLDEEEYVRRVEKILQWIRDGDCYQVNFTWHLDGECYGDPLALYARLRERQPVRYGAFVREMGNEVGGRAILSRSPELFVRREGKRLTCRPMKGTAGAHEDDAALSGSEKNRAENLMIVDLIRNDLGRLVPPGGVAVPALFEVEPFPSLKQMTSTVTAEPVDADLQTIMRALFPCGSITGAPKIRAQEIIHELEAGPRGLYCGALGWLAPDGDFCFNVPIRTLVVAPGGQARLGLGSGIVADSDPAAEWQECLLKGRFLSALPPQFGLIETLRLEADSSPAQPGQDHCVQPPHFPRLEGHLRRLARSAQHFGFSYAPQALREALQTLAWTLAAEPMPQRVRVELAADGRFEITHTPLPQAAGAAQNPLPSLAISRTRIASANPLLRHKTTLRALYEAEWAQASAAGHFELCFFNEHDEVCEGARSNLFAAWGGRLYTPPLRCGLLPGVLREELLQSGQAEERGLRLEDLRRAEALYVGNALRGLVRVRLVEA